MDLIITILPVVTKDLPISPGFTPYNLTAKTKPHGIQTGSPMGVTLGQQYNVGEKTTVILYTNVNRHAGTPNKTKHSDFSLKNKNNVVPVHN